MKLYTYPIAPNTMRVEVVVAEKGLAVETVTVPFDGRDAYRATNPLAQVPALELDDGTILTESLVICRYLDAIGGPPSLFGDDVRSTATIGMWERRAEMLLFNRAVDYGHHSHPLFAPHMTQYPDWARTLLPRVGEFLDLMEARLAQTDHLAGDRSAWPTSPRISAISGSPPIRHCRRAGRTASSAGPGALLPGRAW